MAVLFWSKS
jgi:hypothetical protein